VLGTTLVLGALLPFPSCDAQEEGPITREEYIDLYVRILTAGEAARDSVAATDSANRILTERGLTDEDLLEFAERLSHDPQALADIWGEIEARLKEPAEEDTVRDTDLERSPDRLRN
jgi:hypothetical protein